MQKLAEYLLNGLFFYVHLELEPVFQTSPQIFLWGLLK